MAPGLITTIASVFAVLLLVGPSSSILGILNKAFYAMHDTISQAVALFFEVIVITVTMPWALATGGVIGISLVFTAVVWLRTMALMTVLVWRHDVPIIGESAGKFGLDFIVLTATIGLACVGVHIVFELKALDGVFALTGELGISAILAVGLSYAVARLIKMKEVLEIFAFASWQGGRLLRKSAIDRE